MHLGRDISRRGAGRVWKFFGFSTFWSHRLLYSSPWLQKVEKPKSGVRDFEGKRMYWEGDMWLNDMSGISTVLLKTTFKPIFISRVYSDTSKCQSRGDCRGRSNPVTVTGQLCLFWHLLVEWREYVRRRICWREIEGHPVVITFFLVTYLQQG